VSHKDPVRTAQILKKLGDMFRPIEPSSDQIQNTVPVNSASAHFMGSDIVYSIVLTLFNSFNLFNLLIGTTPLCFAII
jgi:hypothetical protein